MCRQQPLDTHVHRAAPAAPRVASAQHGQRSHGRPPAGARTLQSLWRPPRDVAAAPRARDPARPWSSQGRPDLPRLFRRVVPAPCGDTVALITPAPALR